MTMIKLNLNEMELVAEAFLKHLKSVAFENFMVDTGDDFSLYQRMDAEDLSITMTFDKNGQRLEVGSRIPDGTTFVVEQKAGEDQVEPQGVISGSFKLTDEQVAELEEMFGLNRQERVNLESSDGNIYDLLSGLTGVSRDEVKRQILQAAYAADAPPPDHPDPETLKSMGENSDKTTDPYTDDYAGIRINGFCQSIGQATTASAEITIPLDVIETILDRLFPYEVTTVNNIHL